MPRGRKFTAAEKHFREKEISFSRIIKDLNWQLTETRADLREAYQAIEDLHRAIEQLTAERDEALKLAGMPAEDMKKHIQQTKAAAEVCNILSVFDKIGTLFS